MNLTEPQAGSDPGLLAARAGPGSGGHVGAFRAQRVVRIERPPTRGAWFKATA